MNPSQTQFLSMAARLAVLVRNEDADWLLANSMTSEGERNLQTGRKTIHGKSANYWSGRRESNPRMQLGKLPFYH